MYHIPDDKRAKRSAERIGKSLLTCLNNKNFAEVTVTEIQKTAAVGRATFYRLFDNTADVLAFLCDNVFEQVGRGYLETNTNNPKKLTIDFIRKWMENKSLLKAIADCNRMDFIYNAHVKYLGENIDFFFPSIQTDKTQITYLMTTMTACTSAFLTAWLKNGEKETAEQLQNKLKNCFALLYAVYA